MNYSDTFFEFPVRIYDRFSSQSAEEKEKNLSIPLEGEWREGWNRLDYTEISSWSDYFDSMQGPEGVDDIGFLNTLIFTYTQGSYICTWKKQKFESKLDEHVKNMEKAFPQSQHQTYFV